MATESRATRYIAAHGQQTPHNTYRLHGPGGTPHSLLPPQAALKPRGRIPYPQTPPHPVTYNPLPPYPPPRHARSMSRPPLTPTHAIRPAIDQHHELDTLTTTRPHQDGKWGAKLQDSHNRPLCDEVPALKRPRKSGENLSVVTFCGRYWCRFRGFVHR